MKIAIVSVTLALALTVISCTTPTKTPDPGFSDVESSHAESSAENRLGPEVNGYFLTKKKAYDGDELRYQVHYELDSKKKVINASGEFFGFPDVKKISDSYEYDNRGRILRYISGKKSNQREYERDATGKVSSISFTRADGSEYKNVRLLYENKKLIERNTVRNYGTTRRTSNTQYSYDAKGLLEEISTKRNTNSRAIKVQCKTNIFESELAEYKSICGNLGNSEYFDKNGNLTKRKKFRVDNMESSVSTVFFEYVNSDRAVPNLELFKQLLVASSSIPQLPRK